MGLDQKIMAWSKEVTRIAVCPSLVAPRIGPYRWVAGGDRPRLVDRTGLRSPVVSSGAECLQERNCVGLGN